MNSVTAEKIAVIGLGYVGLPVAVAFGKKAPDTLGFDVNQKRIDTLSKGHDWTGEVTAEDLSASRLTFTADVEQLKDRTFFIVAVPTPIDSARRPDLTPVMRASETVGKALTKGAVVVYESTVYPGVTEEVCAPILEEVSGLKCGEDFFLGYSPERINPGDKEHTLERITKVVSGQNADTLERVARTYELVIDAGVHRAPTIKVAEAAKVIENTQRDLNIALMNEIALIFDRLDIRTKDVLEAAGTKWNFLPFSPGLVGGHCIGVDPYYLTAKAEEVGYHPQVILAGRRINDGMGAFVARKLVKLFIDGDTRIREARVGVLGLTFKENVPDIRNSRVPDIIRELADFAIEPMVHDPHAEPEEAMHEYGVRLSPLSEYTDLDALVWAVPHAAYAKEKADILSRLRQGGVLIDVKSALSPSDVPAHVKYWSL